MKTTIAIGLAALALTGCMSAAQQAEDRASYERLESTLSAAQDHARVRCTGKDACDRAWALTKVYVEQNSSMKVRLADDTLIDTFNPVNYGDASFKAVKSPEGDLTVIRLYGQCRGMYGTDGKPGPNYSQCATAIGVPQNLFAKFVADRM